MKSKLLLNPIFEIPFWIRRLATLLFITSSILLFHRTIVKAVEETLSAAAPAQFHSNEAAVILGLDKEETVDEALIKKTARQLMRQYHQDLAKQNQSSLSANDLKIISQKINKARKSLIDFIKNGGSIHHSRLNEDSANSKFAEDIWNFYTQQGAGRSSYSANDPWGEEFVKDQEGEKGLKVYTGRERYVYLQDTIFRGIPADLEHLFMPLTGFSTAINFDTNLILVMHRSTFPIMEARFYKSQPSSDGMPTLQKTFKVEYVPGYHKAGTGKYFDAIVFDDGSYLMPKADFTYYVKPMNNTPRGTYEAKARGLQSFVGFGNFSQTLFSIDPEIELQSVLTGPKTKTSENQAALPPTWDQIQISGNNEVIRLPQLPDESEKSPSTRETPAEVTKAITPTTSPETLPEVSPAEPTPIQKPELSAAQRRSAQLSDLHDRLQSLVENQTETLTAKELRQIGSQLAELLPSYSESSPPEQQALLNTLESWFSIDGVEAAPEVLKKIIELKFRDGLLAAASLAKQGPLRNNSQRALLLAGLLELSESGDFIPLKIYLSGIIASKHLWKEAEKVILSVLKHQALDNKGKKDILNYYKQEILSDPSWTNYEAILTTFIKVAKESEIPNLISILYRNNFEKLEAPRMTRFSALVFANIESYFSPEGSSARHFLNENQQLSAEAKDILSKGLSVPRGDARIQYYKRQGLIKPEAPLITSFNSCKASLKSEN